MTSASQDAWLVALVAAFEQARISPTRAVMTETERHLHTGTRAFASTSEALH